MIIDDAQPCRMVEEIGFRELVSKLDPTYVLPTKKVFADTDETREHY